MTNNTHALNGRYICKNAQETEALGRSFAPLLSPGTIICMHGTLGAGKTCFIQGVARGLGIEEAVTSPSFTLASEYQGTLPLYHIDVYRIEDSEEFELLGLEEYLYGHGLCFIEWSEKVQEALPEETLHIEIQILEDGSRQIRLEDRR